MLLQRKYPLQTDAVQGQSKSSEPESSPLSIDTSVSIINPGIPSLDSAGSDELYKSPYFRDFDVLTKTIPQMLDNIHDPWLENPFPLQELVIKNSKRRAARSDSTNN
jgi:hypothetical protein